MKIFAIILVLYCCIFTATFTRANTRWLVDQTGENVELPEKPRRVVALAPSITEMTYSLGAEDRLIGVTRYSNYPPAAEKLPKVGSYVQLDLEKIVAMQPDLCLAIKDGNPRRSVDAIKDFGIPVFAIDPRDIEQIMEAFLLLGEILGASEKAEEVVADMSRRLLRVKEKVAFCQSRPKVFFQISDSPIVSAGRDSYIDRLILLAGGSNLAGNLTEYPRYSWENIMLLQPEVVLISSMAGDKSPEQLTASWRQWPEIPAVKNKRLYVVDADLFNRPTLRLIAGLETLVGILHPEVSGENGAK